MVGPISEDEYGWLRYEWKNNPFRMWGILLLVLSVILVAAYRVLIGGIIAGVVLIILQFFLNWKRKRKSD